MLGFVGGFCYILVMLPEIGGRPVSGNPRIGDIAMNIRWQEMWAPTWRIIPLNKLGGGFKYVFFYLGKISNLTNVFQMGRNHQPELVSG